MTMKNVKKEDMKFDPALAPKHDEKLMQLFTDAVNGKIGVYFAAVPLSLIIPFDINYRPDKHPAGAQAIELFFQRMAKGEISPVVVYQNEYWFVLSDDYISLFAALRGMPDYMPCFVLGKPDHPLVKDIQGPIAQKDVKSVLGLG